MPSMDDIKEAVYRGRFDDQMSKGAEAAAKRLKDLGVAVSETDEKVKKAEKSFESLNRRYDENAKLAAQVARATREFEQVVRAANAAVETGARSQEAANELIHRAMLVRDAAVSKARAEAEKQKAVYDQLEQASIKAARGMDKLNEATEKATRFQAQLNALLGVSARTTDQYAQRAADIQAYGKSLDDLRAKISPLFAAEQKFTESMEELNMALKVGAINTIEASLAADRYRASLENMARAATAASQTRFNQLAGITLPDAANSASRAADIQAYGRALDDLRAKLNPAYAAERDLKQSIDEVNMALRTGAINAREASEAMAPYVRALQQMKAASANSFQQQLNNNLGLVFPDPVKAAARAEDFRATGVELDAVRAKFVPLEKEAQRYRAALIEINEAQKRGILTAKEAQAARLKEREHYESSTRSIGNIEQAYTRAGRGLNLTSQQLVQLSYQVNDVIAQSAVGTNPLIILAQQGPQVVQALGGITGAWRALLAVVTPATAALAALAVAITAPLLVVNSVESRLADFRNSLRQFRDDFAETAKFMETETRRINLQSPGFSLSDVTEAAKAIEQARTVAQISTPLSDLVALSRDLSRVMGTDLAKAAERVAAAMRDPASVARELAEQGFPGVNEQLRRQVELLQRTGERQQAFNTLQEAMRRQLQGAAQDLSPLEASLHGVTKAFQEMWEAIRPGLETVGRWMIDWVRAVANNFTTLAGAIRDIVSAVAGAGSARAPAAPGGAYNTPTGVTNATLRDAIGYVESRNRYGEQNSAFFSGRYQFGVAALHDTGIYQMGPSDRDRSGRPVNAWSGTWNFPGVNSIDDFLANPAAQDAAYERYIATLNGIIDRQRLLDGNPTVNGIPVTRDALLGVGWGRPSNMAALVRGTPATDAAGDLTALERFMMFSRTVAQGGTAPNGMPGATPSNTPQPTSASGETQAAIDSAIRAAMGYTGQNSRTRENAIADIENFSNARRRIEEQNTALLAQRDALTQGTAEWQRLDDQLNRNNESIRVLNTGIDGARAIVTETRTPVEELIRGWERSGEAARDAGSGYAFVRDRLAELDAASLRQRGTTATQEERTRATSLALAELNEQYGNTVRAVDRQIAGVRRQNEAYALGAAAMQTMEMTERAREEVRKTTISGTDAEAIAVENLARKYQELANAEAERAVARRNNDLQRDLEFLQTEANVIGLSAVNRERELAAARAIRQILAENPNADLNSDINRRNIDLSANLAQGRVELERLQSSFNEIARIGQQAFDRIGGAITQAFVEGNVSAINWKNITKAMISEVIQALLRLAILNPILNAAFGQNNPTLNSVMQASQLIGGGGGGSGLLGGGGSGGLLNQASSAYSLGKSIFGGGGGSTGIMAYINNPIWQSGAGFFAPAGMGATNTALAGMGAGVYGPATAEAVAAAAGQSGVFGTLGSVSLGTYAAGIGGGYMLGTTFGNMIAQTEAQRTNAQIGSGVGAVGGAAAGALIGSVIPGVGTAIGALVGGLVGGSGGGALGGIIGPSNEFRGGDVGIGVGPNGQLIITGAGGKRWNESGARQATQGMIDPINQLLAASGVRIEGAGGFDWDRGSGGLTLGFSGSGGSFNTMGPTELWDRVRGNLKSDNETMQALLDQSWMRSWEDLNVTGNYALSGNKNMLTALRSGGVQSRDDVAAAHNFITNVYEPMLLPEQQASSWANRIKAIHDTFGSAIDTARRFGLATEELAKKQDEAIRIFREDHALVMKSIYTNLGSRKLVAEAALTDDPVEAAKKQREAALMEFDYNASQEKKSFDQQLKDLYVNVWNPTEYARLILEQDEVLAKERLALWKQYEDQITAAQAETIKKMDDARAAVVDVLGGLVEYASGLRTGEMSPLSPMERLNAARDQFTTGSAAALGGDFDALRKLQGYSDTYLGLARDVYGGGIGYAEAFSQVLDVLGQVGELSEDALTASAFAAISRENTEILADTIKELSAQITALTTELRQSNNIPASMT